MEFKSPQNIYYEPLLVHDTLGWYVDWRVVVRKRCRFPVPFARDVSREVCRRYRVVQLFAYLRNYIIHNITGNILLPFPGWPDARIIRERSSQLSRTQEMIILSHPLPVVPRCITSPCSAREPPVTNTYTRATPAHPATAYFVLFKPLAGKRCGACIIHERFTHT
jgi:hypothetical protein